MTNRLIEATELAFRPPPYHTGSRGGGMINNKYQSLLRGGMDNVDNNTTQQPTNTGGKQGEGEGGGITQHRLQAWVWVELELSQVTGLVVTAQQQQRQQ